MFVDFEELDAPVKRAVKLGIEWLETHGGENWAEDIWLAVVYERFNMNDCKHCAVGTAVGDYYDWFNTTASENLASDCGFFAQDKDPFTWEELAYAWASASYARLISQGHEVEIPDNINDMINQEDYEL
jgi:hypothetical protein